MASGGAGEPSTAPQPDRWYTLRLGSSLKDDRPSSKFCTLRYEFQPASIDKSQPGSLHRSKENRITVEFQNNQPGKPKVTFEGASEDCKDNDGILFFDGQTFRLERLHRAVKRLRHVRQHGESGTASASALAAAAAPSSVSPSIGIESRSPPLSKTSKSLPLSKTMAHPLPLEIERIDVGEPEISVPKHSGIMATPPNPYHQSPMANSPEQEENINIDDDETVTGADAILRPVSDDENADIDIGDDDPAHQPSTAEALHALANVGAGSGDGDGDGEDSPSSSSSSSSSGSGSSDSDSDVSEDNSSSSAADEEIDIDGDV